MQQRFPALVAKAITMNSVSSYEQYRHNEPDAEQLEARREAKMERLWELYEEEKAMAMAPVDKLGSETEPADLPW